MFRRNAGQRRRRAAGLRRAEGWLGQVPPDVLDYRRREAELVFRRIGITFAVYGDTEAQERLIPFDVIPRILSAEEWQVLQRRSRAAREGAQRLSSSDVYCRREILKAGIIPRISSSRTRFSARR